MGGVLRPVPLSLIPLVLYGVGGLFGWDAAATGPGGEAGASLWDRTLVDLTLVSGEVFAVHVADAIVAIAGLTLLVSLLRTTFGTPTVTASLLSIIVLCGYVVAFLLADFTATSTFFTLLVLAFVDTIATIALAMKRGRRTPAAIAAETAARPSDSETPPTS